MTVTLHGFEYSVYTWIARLALVEKGVAFQVDEVNPFFPETSVGYEKINPLRLVPSLSHGDFTLYETGAILNYIDGAFDGPALTPEDPKAAARLIQIISLVDNFVYWPMVRQVFSHSVFIPRFGEAGDATEIAAGLEGARRILPVLDDLVAEGLVLNRRRTTLADIHLAPMIAYFSHAPEGAEMLREYRHLAGWWDDISARDTIKATDPGLPPDMGEG